MTIVRGTPPNYYERPCILEDESDQREADLVEEKRMNRLRKAFSLATDLHLTKDERYELAQMLIGVDKDDGGSWKVLNPKQLHDLITMMEGYILLSHIMSNR